MMKIAARTKVNLKTIFSNPLLVKDAVPPVGLEKPLPLDCIRISAINETPEAVCAIRRSLFISKSIIPYLRLLSNPVDEGCND